MAKPAKAAPEEAEAPAKPKSKRLLLAVAGILILGALGGGAWFLLKGMKHEEKKEEPKAVPVSMALETFTANLQPEEGEKFLQVDITLELASAKVQEKVAERLPRIRNNLMLLMSGKRPSELIPTAGKVKLQQEIAKEIETTLGLRAPTEKKLMHEGEAASGVAAPERVEAATAASVPAATAPVGQEAAAGGGVIAVYFTRFIVQ